MKILVLSLLRLGDIVLTAPALRGLREQNPDAEIHLMINSQFKQIAPLLPFIDTLLFFDRERLQKGLGDANVPMFDSYERLQDFVDEVDAHHYDCIVNLTHSRLSGWLMSVLNAKDRIGLSFDGQGRATFGSNWFRYLNSQVDAEGTEVFHYSDVFKFALNLNEASVRFDSLVETGAGAIEANAYFAAVPKGTELVAVQALTSDPKKDWGFDKYTAALKQIQSVRPKTEFAIFGAPFERSALEAFMVKLASEGVNARLAILTFEGAFSLLKRCKLLLTGDTSIKHLAVAARVPVVEISLGSSDFYRTGAYQHGSVILQSREACAPCVHSKPCHREFHACAKRIPADAVAMASCESLEGRSFQLRSIAEEYRNEVQILKVDAKSAGFWAVHAVDEPFTEVSVGRWIDLTCRKLWLDSSARHERMGTEILKLGTLFKNIYPEVSDIEWQQLLGDFERQAAAVEARVNGFKVGLHYLRGGYEDPKRMTDFVRGLITFRDRIRHSVLLSSFKASLDKAIEDDISPAFPRFRQMTELVSEIAVRTEIYLKLIRGLSKTSEPEKGVERV